MVEGKGMAITSLVCGVIGLVLALLGILLPFIGCGAWILAILAIIFGGIGIAKTNKNPNHEGRALAITGLVTGILALIAPFIIFLVFVGSFFFFL